MDVKARNENTLQQEEFPTFSAEIALKVGESYEVEILDGEGNVVLVIKPKPHVSKIKIIKKWL